MKLEKLCLKNLHNITTFLFTEDIWSLTYVNKRLYYVFKPYVIKKECTKLTYNNGIINKIASIMIDINKIIDNKITYCAMCHLKNVQVMHSNPKKPYYDVHRLNPPSVVDGYNIKKIFSNPNNFSNRVTPTKFRLFNKHGTEFSCHKCKKILCPKHAIACDRCSRKYCSDHITDSSCMSCKTIIYNTPTLKNKDAINKRNNYLKNMHKYVYAAMMGKQYIEDTRCKHCHVKLELDEKIMCLKCK